MIPGLVVFFVAWRLLGQRMRQRVRRLRRRPHTASRPLADVEAVKGTEER